MKKVGIRQVAAEAGVSIAAVSKILNPESVSTIQVSEETRRRVLAAVDQLGYRPSYSARLLRGESSRTIGFALSLPLDYSGAYLSDYYVRILNGMGHIASLNDYQILLLNGVDYRHFMDIKRLDAMVVVDYRLRENPHLSAMQEMFDHFKARQYPFVVINGNDSVPCIRVDNRAGMLQVAEHIEERGYRSVGFIGEITPNPQRHHLERVDALRRELEKRRIAFSEAAYINGVRPDLPEQPRSGRYSHADGRMALRYLYEKKQSYVFFKYCCIAVASVFDNDSDKWIRYGGSESKSGF